MGRPKRSSSGDKFSFPVIMSDDFEFGSTTPPASPADNLFSNGKILPHTFPIHTPNNFSYSRSTSSSKGSLMSSRSNSTTSSRSSTSGSARTSTSEASERRLPPAACGSSVAGRKEKIVRPVVSYQYQYGSSRRWQLIAAAPVLKHQGSRSRKNIDSVLDPKGSKDEKCDESSKSWFGRKFFKLFLSACKECHAIKT